jgi:tetraprenyl-beta-curcumene synthase
VPALGDRRFVARTGLALSVANVRYWSTVAPVVRRELRRWELRAQAIEDPELRALALEKLRGEGFHAEAAAMLATLAPRRRRRYVVEAIVALELLFDYLDGLTERPSGDPLGEGERLFEALSDAVVVPRAGVGKKLEPPPRSDDDDGYLEDLSRTVSCALARLPAAPTISEVAQRIAALGGQAQTRMHAASQLGTEQVEAWARSEAEGTRLEWRELLAGAASSVLALHALIAAAADPRTTGEEAEEIASAYLSTCVLLTLLDGLVDYDEDTQAGGATSRVDALGSSDGHGPGGLGYIDLYGDRDELSQALTDATRRAASQARALRHGPHHAMTLVGVVAYYTSAPGARDEPAAASVERTRAQLKPLISPTLALMRGWRLAKRMGTRDRRAPRGGELASFSDKSRFIDKSRGSGGVV